MTDSTLLMMSGSESLLKGRTCLHCILPFKQWSYCTNATHVTYYIIFPVLLYNSQKTRKLKQSKKTNGRNRQSDNTEAALVEAALL